MKVIALNGSPMGKDGNTAVMINAFLQGARKAGAQTEEVCLIDKDIHHCTGCFSCWFKTPGKCVFREDMDTLLPMFTEADIVCFATPVFTHNMTAVLKNFIDRLVPLKSPRLEQNAGDYDLEDTVAKTSLYVTIANAGFPGENNFDTLREVLSSCNPVLEIYRNCGRMLRTQDSRVQDYLDVVSKASMELVQNGMVTNETREALCAEMMPTEEYIRILGM